ncbi:hypothetical protein [Rhodococcus sp. SJ]|uniref:hypothetical protein n=1 Tax=Rhodococcus sp. SJ TaxID=3434112 RepID=UPI003D7ABBF1
MPTHRLEADYLVIGCGAAGMAFADALITDSDTDVVMVDRRHAPGGHWNEAYPFVRLHQPSAYYGVNSLPLGTDVIDRTGPNGGMYEQASAPEICAYFDRVMRSNLLTSGAVRYFPMSEYVGDHRFVSRISTDRYEVEVRTALVDATYLEPAIPATFTPPFDVAPGVRCVPVDALARVAEPPERYVIIGAGKTAMDACLWLLQLGLPPDAIQWVKPREAWLRNRRFAQGGELVDDLIEGLARQMEAAARARTPAELFARLEASEQLLRVDEHVLPTMYKGPTVSTAELEQLRRIEDVVRLGHVRRIEHDTIVLDHGTIRTGPGHLHVHCAAPGLNPAPAVPIFEEGRITLQPVRTGLVPFNAALVGFVEATGRDPAEKNRLCPPNRLPDVPLDWIRGTLVETNAEYAWSKEPDMADWLERSRLNTSRGLRHRADRPLVREATRRFATHVRPALANLTGLLDDARQAA